MPRAKKNIAKRFGDPMRVHISYVPIPASERLERSTGLFNTYVDCLRDILRREPTDQEIFGEVSIEKSIQPGVAIVAGDRD